MDKKIKNYPPEPTQEELDEAAKNLGIGREDPIEDDNVVQIGAAKKKKTREATRQEYLDLFNDILGNLKRDIFTDTLMYHDEESDKWLPVANETGLIRSECRHLSIDNPVKYSASAVDDHLSHLIKLYPKKFIPELPKWDGKDRITEMAEMLIPNPEYEVTQDDIIGVLKEWMANIFRKIEDPTMDDYIQTRSFIFILQGGQQIGKDAWIRMLLAGLGQWVTNFTHGANDRDTIMQIHRCAVLNISEFDRLSKYETSFIKDIVTRSDSNMRSSHAKEEQIRDSRCSFIASVNPIDILRDTGQNTRYCIIPLKDIDFNNRRKDVKYSLQILAQANQLKKDDFYAGDCWKSIRALVDDHTPEDPLVQLAEWWEAEIPKWLDADPVTRAKTKQLAEESGYVFKDEVELLLNDAAKVFKLSRNALLSRLYNAGLRYKTPKGGRRCIKLSRETMCRSRSEVPYSGGFSEESTASNGTYTADTTADEKDYDFDSF